MTEHDKLAAFDTGGPSVAMIHFNGVKQEIDFHKLMEEWNERIPLMSMVFTLWEALDFYAVESNWHSPSTGFALQYDPEPSEVDKDRGKIARDTMEELRK